MRIISGKFKGKVLKAPRGTITRPTSDRTKEAVFNILDNRIKKWDKIKVADVFAGSGALGIEALSRGAGDCLFIENNPEALDCLKGNLATINMLDRSKFIGDYQRLEEGNVREAYDLVFMDPPYHQNLIPLALNILFKKEYLHHQTTIVVESEKNEEIALSSDFNLLTQRIYGKAKISFLTLA